METAQFSFDSLIDVLADRIAAKMQPSAQKNDTIAPRLLDVRAAATYLGITTHSVRHQIAKGQLPAVRRGSRVFLDVRDLDRVIDQSKQTAIQ